MNARALGGDRARACRAPRTDRRTAGCWRARAAPGRAAARRGSRARRAAGDDRLRVLDRRLCARVPTRRQPLRRSLASAASGWRPGRSVDDLPALARRLERGHDAGAHERRLADARRPDDRRSAAARAAARPCARCRGSRPKNRSASLSWNAVEAGIRALAVGELRARARPGSSGSSRRTSSARSRCARPCACAGSRRRARASAVRQRRGTSCASDGIGSLGDRGSRTARSVVERLERMLARRASRTA